MAPTSMSKPISISTPAILDRIAGTLAGIIMLVLLIGTFFTPPAGRAAEPQPIIIVATPLPPRLAPVQAQIMPTAIVAQPTEIPPSPTATAPTPVPPLPEAPIVVVEAAPVIAPVVEAPAAPPTAEPPPPPTTQPAAEAPGVVRQVGKMTIVRDRPPERQERP